jgi:hypothetical protein
MEAVVFETIDQNIWVAIDNPTRYGQNRAKREFVSKDMELLRLSSDDKQCLWK